MKKKYHVYLLSNLQDQYSKDQYAVLGKRLGIHDTEEEAIDSLRGYRLSTYTYVTIIPVWTGEK